jgi:NADH dehydrogenase
MSGLPAAEDGPSHYLRSKGVAERTVREAGNDLAWTIFRPSVIFGPGDSFLNRFAQLLAMLPVLPLARIDARLSPVYVGDVVSAFCVALDLDRTIGHSYDLAGPQVLTLGDTVRYVRDRLGLKRLIFGLPDALGALQAGVMELLPGKPLSLDNYRSLSADSIAANDGLRLLGITPTPLDAVVPLYFGGTRRTARYDAWRKRRPAI